MKNKSIAALWGQRKSGDRGITKNTKMFCSVELDFGGYMSAILWNHFYIQRNRKQLTICKQMDNPTGFCILKSEI